VSIQDIQYFCEIIHQNQAVFNKVDSDLVRNAIQITEKST